MNIYQHLFCIVPIVLGLYLGYKREFGLNEDHIAKALVFWFSGVIASVGTICYLGYIGYTFLMFLGGL